MEYIIDDKGNKLKFVINKKYPVKKLDRVFLATDVSRKIYQHVAQIGNKCTLLAI